jgi:transcription initiation factor TFIIH subunit 2
VALYILRYVPEYGHKELLILYSSLSTCDPGDVFEAIRECKQSKLRVSVICLAAEVTELCT